MAPARRAGPILALAGLTLPLMGAGLFLELPDGESAGAWEPVLQSAGLTWGAADHPPHARLVDNGGDGCVLQVTSSWGAVHSEQVPCPASASDREEIAALTVLMLEPLLARRTIGAGGAAVGVADPAIAAAPTSEPGLDDEPSPSLASASDIAPEPPPPLFEALPGSARATASIRAEAATADTTTGALDPGGGAQRGDALGMTPPPAPPLPTPGTTKFNPLCFYTDCAVSFDRARCSQKDGCSTADKCPDTYWLDFDRDGYGSPQTCLSLATEQGVGAWVQNVGDCDDRHSSMHPGAEEIIGDGIDNDCDGVAR